MLIVSKGATPICLLVVIGLVVYNAGQRTETAKIPNEEHD